MAGRKEDQRSLIAVQVSDNPPVTWEVTPGRLLDELELVVGESAAAALLADAAEYAAGTRPSIPDDETRVTVKAGGSPSRLTFALTLGQLARRIAEALDGDEDTAGRLLAAAASRSRRPGRPPVVGARTAQVLRLFLADPHTPRDEWDVVQATRLSSDTVHWVFNTLNHAGWIAPVPPGNGQAGTARTRYTMPSTGVAAARRQLAEMAAEHKLITGNRASGFTWELIAGRLGYESSSGIKHRYNTIAAVLKQIPPAHS